MDFINVSILVVTVTSTMFLGLNLAIGLYKEWMKVWRSPSTTTTSENEITAEIAKTVEKTEKTETDLLVEEVVDLFSTVLDRYKSTTKEIIEEFVQPANLAPQKSRLEVLIEKILDPESDMRVEELQDIAKLMGWKNPKNYRKATTVLNKLMMEGVV